MRRRLQAGADALLRPLEFERAGDDAAQRPHRLPFLAERGFEALTRLVQAIPARAIDYPDTASGIALVEALA